MALTALTGSEFEILDCVGECLSPMRLFMPESLAFVSQADVDKAYQIHLLILFTTTGRRNFDEH